MITECLVEVSIMSLGAHHECIKKEYSCKIREIRYTVLTREDCKRYTLQNTWSERTKLQQASCHDCVNELTTFKRCSVTENWREVSNE